MTQTRKARSISVKIGTLVAVAVGSAMIFLAAIGLWQEAVRYLDGRRDALLATASAFAAASGEAVASHDQRGAYLAIRGIGSVPGMEFASLEDGSGVPLADIGSGVRLAGDLDLTEEDAKANPLALLGTRTVSASVPVKNGGVNVGRLKIVGTVADLWIRLRDVLTTTALGGSGALVIALTISLRLQRSITRPLIMLTQVMSAIETRHDYTTRVDIDSNDEIGVLATRFNGMLGEVRERDRLLSAHRDRLESDVAERTHDLSRAKEDAEAATVAKSQFLATMSHEIRTPMNGMLVMAELLAGSDLPERQRRYAEVIARSGQSLLAIINDILDFSKIEAGKLTLEATTFSAADVLDTVVTLFAERAAGKGLDLAAYVAPDVPAEVVGDPVRLTQVLSNLVNNALKFTEAGHVLACLEWSGSELRFSVSDTGIGIPWDKIATIFGAFSQADQSTTRRFGGTGLGLSICKRIVDAMGGTIGVSSGAGQGSTFVVSLPISAAENPSGWSSVPPRPVAVALSGLATGRSVSRSLTERGFTVLTDPPSGPHDLVIDAGVLLARGRSGEAVRVVGVAGMNDAAGVEAVRLGLADTLVRRPIVQAEWREVIARLGGDLPFDTANRDPHAREAVSGIGLAGRRVLVADDSAVNREVACAALARLHVTAEAVEDGRAALEALRSGGFDLVLMDGSMPDLDGYEATRLLRQEEARTGRARVPVIALTAHVIGSAAEAWRDCGMDDVLHKPFTVAKLADVLQRNLAPADVRPDRPFEARATSAPPPPAGDEVELLDMDTVASIEEMAAAGAGADFAARIFRLFAEGGPPGFEDLRSAAAHQDASAVASASHRLKSMSLNVGGSRLAAVLASFEHAARDLGAIPERECIDRALSTFVDTSEALLRRSTLAREADVRGRAG